MAGMQKSIARPFSPLIGIYLKKVGPKSSSAETESAESDYLGNYSLTLPKERITLNLASDGSFILAGLGGSNVVGTWKEKGKGWQAWNGWGGDAGFSWSKKVVSSI